MSAAVRGATLHQPIRRGEHQAWALSLVPARVALRTGVLADAGAIHRLISDHTAESRLLARARREIEAHIHRFTVAFHGARVIACADLAPLSASTAEVRSLVVDPAARSGGIGRTLVDALILRARTGGFDTLCAFTHAPGYFVQRGFSIVPHTWLPEKIERDCQTCALFRRCGQYAVAMPLNVAHTRIVGADASND